nr:MAG TPA_asm: hypothetical protein [Caudoviricetes sp.]
MKLNSIQCRDYSAGERFFAVLQNSNVWKPGVYGWNEKE